MRFAKHLKPVAVVVLHIGQNSDWHKLTRRETELQSAFAFALGFAPPVVLLACPANTLVAKSRHKNRVVTLFIVFSFRIVF